MGIDLSQNAPDFTFSTKNLILKSKAGTPVAPRNFNRALDTLIQKAGVPRITPHVSRHMAATFNKNIGTPLKDVQQILGHAHSDVTQKIYQHGTYDIQKQALTTIDELLHAKDKNCCQKLLSPMCTEKKNEPLSRPANLFRRGRDGRARTYDTRFWSPIQAPDISGFTPVLKHLQTTTTTQLFGAIAVKNCCQIHRGIKIHRLCKELIRLCE